MNFSKQFLYSCILGTILLSGVGCAKKLDDARMSSEIQSKFSQDSSLASKQLTAQADSKPPQMAENNPPPANMNSAPPADNTQAPPPPPPAPKKLIIDQGTQIAVRLVDAIDSEKNQTGDTFHATLNAPLTSDGEE